MRDFFTRCLQQHAMKMLLALFMLSFWACKQEEIGVMKYDPSKPVVVDRILPDSGGVTTQLVVVGKNFGTDTSLVKVYVNGKIARVIGVNDTRIYAVVPSRAGTGKVEVVLNGGLANAVTATSTTDFKYIFRQNVLTVCGITDNNGYGGQVDGTLATAKLLFPYYLSIDKSDNIFVTERRGRVGDVTSEGDRQDYRLISLQEGTVSTKLMAGGSFNTLRATAFNVAEDTLWCINDNWGNQNTALFSLTRNQGWYDATSRYKNETANGIAINPVDGSIFYSQYLKSTVNLYNPRTGANKALLTLGENYVLYMTFSPDGKYLYISVPDGYESERGKVYRAEWDFATKTLSNAEFIVDLDYLKWPEQIACDKAGNLYICDSGHHTIEIWDPISRRITTFAGTRNERGMLDGLPLKSKFNYPTGVCVGKDGAIYVADNGNHRIRKIVVE